MAAIDQLTGLVSVLNAVQGGSQKQTSTTSGGSQTQQTQLSDEAVNERIRQILRGPGGVRDIGGAARRSGLYNNSTEELLLGNLYSSAAAQGEIARAPTVTTSTPQTTTTKVETPGMDLGAIAGTVAGAALLNQVIGTGGNLIGDGISNLLGFGGSGSTRRTLDTLAQEGLTGGVNFGDGNYGLSAALNEGPGISFSGDSFGAQLSQGLPGTGTGVGSAGLDGTRRNDNNEFDLAGAVTNAIGGLLGGGGIGGLVSGITSGLGGGSAGGGGGGTSGGSVICTALMEKGELDEKLYAAGSKYLKELNPLTKVGYHLWAIGVASRIRKGSKMAATICRPFARSRTALLATNGGVWDHLKHPLGAITKYVGEPACYVIGWATVNLALWADLRIREV